MHTDMDLNNLKYAPQIFRRLNGGHFICASSRNDEQKQWFDALEADWEGYAEAWKATTGLELARGDGYYYFRRKMSGDRRNFEDIAKDYMTYVTVIDLLYSMDQSFGVGKIITKSWALTSLDANPAAQEICKVRYKGATKDEWADALIDELKKLEIVDCFMNEEQYEELYPVTEAFEYYTTFIETIKFSSKDEESAVESEQENAPSLFDEEADVEQE